MRFFQFHLYLRNNILIILIQQPSTNFSLLTITDKNANVFNSHNQDSKDHIESKDMNTLTQIYRLILQTIDFHRVYELHCSISQHIQEQQ